MSGDLRILSWRKVIEIADISFSPPLLVLMGEEMREAEEVRVNGVSLPFSREEDRKLVVLLPEGTLPKHIIILGGRSSSPIKNGRIELSMVPPLGSVSGIARTIQRLLLMLLSSPSSDVFHPQQGAGLRDFIGKNVEDLALVNSAVKKGVRDVLRQRDMALGSLKEELIDVNVEDMIKDEVTGDVLLLLRLRTPKEELTLSLSLAS